jgi:hypothetical protein
MIKTILLSALTYVALGLSVSSRMRREFAELSDAASLGIVRRNNITHVDIINEIKNRTNKWQPYEPHQHPFANKTDDELKQMVGSWMGQPNTAST